MIIVKLSGGLGNQLFQYAAGRSLAKQRNDSLQLDITGFQRTRFETTRMYKLGAFAIDAHIAAQDVIARFRSRFHLLENIGIGRKRGYVKERTPFVFDPILATHLGDLYLDGYWQNERYFFAIRETLLKEIVLNGDQRIDHFPVLRAINATNSIALHVRRGDYVSNGKINRMHGTCDPDYYHRAINLVMQKVVAPHFFVFSDDIQWVKENIRIECPVTYVSDGVLQDHQELMLMKQCKHAIIANSSFSWWGAWLNENPGKVVVAPQRWFNTTAFDTRDLIPDGWIRI